MGKGFFIGRFWGLTFKVGLVLSLLVTTALVVARIMAPSWIENLFTKTMSIAGYEATLKVDQIGFRRSSVSQLAVDGPGLRARIGEIEANYLLERFHRSSVELHALEVRLNLDEWLAADDEAADGLSIEQKLRRWGRLDYFERASFQDALLEITSGDLRKELRLTGLLDGSVRPHLAIECNSSLADFDLEINKYGYGVGLSGHLGIDDLSEPSRLSRALLHADWPTGLEVLGGKLDLQAGVRVKGDDFVQGVVQATAANLALMLPPQEVNGTRWPASATSFSLVANEDAGAWRVKLGGDFIVGSFLQLENLLLEGYLADDQVNLDLQNVDGRLTLPDDQVHFTGLRGAAKLTKAESWNLTGSSTFPFAELGYGGDEIVLYDGLVHLAMQGQDGPVKVTLPPCYGLLPAAQVSLAGLSFEGELLSLTDPAMTTPQILRCERIMLAEEPAVEDLAMTFRVDDKGTILVDALDFETNGVRMKIRPQRAEVVLTDAGGAVLELNDTTIELPNEELTITGVAGVVRCDSIDPLKILDPQELTFDLATFGDLHWGPGQIAFTLDENGTFALVRCEGDFLGGTLSMEPTGFDLFAERITFSFTLVLHDVVGERLSEVMPGFEGTLQGLLTGRIPLGDQDGDWNYLDGGYLELAVDPAGHLSYPADGLLTEGMDPESSNFKRSQLVELALQDLKVKKLRFEFLEDLLEGRVIKGEVLGSSMVGEKLINVTYRPKLTGDLFALLRQLEFGGLSFE
jgi:hypothetical protein